MPRQLFDIRGFNYGIISSLDEEDIPQESASSSLNIDGDAGEGILQGIPADIELLIDSNLEGDIDDAIGYISQGKLIENNGIYDLVYHDSYNNTISAITDFYGTTASTKRKFNLVSSLTSDNVAMTVSGKEVHIGIEGMTPYWVGKIGHGQFDYGISWAIASIADSGGKIQVTTTPTHSLRNGDIVKISGATGDDAAALNGIWAIESVNNFAKTFILTGSSSAGGTTITLPGTAELYLVTEYAECEADITFGVIGGLEGEFYISGLNDHNATGYFQAGTYYAWALSLTYDGVQESPIVFNTDDTVATESDYYEIVISAVRAMVTTGADPGGNSDGIGSFNKRITAVNLYRADSTDDIADNIGFYRLIASIDINDNSWLTATNNKALTIRDYGTSYQINSVNFPTNFITYEENSGMPETIADTTPKYSLSKAGGGYHFIANCSHPNIPDATRYIFKSKQLRYDMFDWSSEYLIMPEPITALEYYNGRLFAFSLNATYQINPELFYIEDVFNDAGCNNSRAVNTNEYGMFFCNTNQAWMYNGGQFLLISDAIRQTTSSGYSWKSFYKTTLTDFIIVSDSKKGYVLFINEIDAATDLLFAMAYSPLKKRWDAFTFGSYTTSANAGAFQGKSGEVYLSNASGTYQLMRHTSNRQAWEWYSQELSFGATRQVKSIVMIKVDSSGTVAITYGVDGATPATSGTSESLINTYAKTIRIKLSASAATTNSVDSLEILYRPLIGLR